MKNWLIITITLLVSAALGTAQAAGDPEAGKVKSASCAACHGMDGNSVNPEWPKLAGQHEEYLVKQFISGGQTLASTSIYYWPSRGTHSEHNSLSAAIDRSKPFDPEC